MKKNMKTVAFFGLLLVYGLIVSACPQSPQDDNDGKDVPAIDVPAIDAPVIDAPAIVKDLPTFEGSFVASENEATQLSDGAQQAIASAIIEVLAHPVSSIRSQNARGDDDLSNHYEWNGISLDYTVSTSDSYPETPYTMSMDQILTINGIYAGYTIAGVYDVRTVWSYISDSDSIMTINFDYTLAVSKEGKGMKVVAAGTITQSDGITTNFHYTVYDNENMQRYDYDYTY